MHATNTIHAFQTAPHCTCNMIYQYASPSAQFEPFIYIHTYMDIQAKYPYQLTVKKSPYLLILYTIEGHAVLTDQQTSVSLDSQTSYFCRENTDFSLKTKSTIWHYKLLIISGQESAFFYNIFSGTGNVSHPLTSGHTLSGLFSMMEHPEKYQIQQPITHIIYTSRLLELIIGTQDGTVAGPDHKIPHYLQEIKAIFDENYQEYYSLDILEKQFGINKYKLAKEFTQYYGISPINYLNIRRIDAAKLLLITTNDRIHEIGQAVGYESTNHFINLFKKHTGTTPLNFRKNQTL